MAAGRLARPGATEAAEEEDLAGEAEELADDAPRGARRLVRPGATEEIEDDLAGAAEELEDDLAGAAAAGISGRKRERAGTKKGPGPRRPPEAPAPPER